ncbi:MAG: ABC transporter substrate-binding protein [Scardovia wiggsiae]|nr:ABC transporter substrate-binding protein [Scardovia wiggsiae]
MKISSKASKVFAAVLSGALLMGLSACGGGAKKSATAAKSTSVSNTITAQVAYSGRDFSPATTSGALPLSANWHVTEPLYALDYSNYKVFNALAKGDPEKVSDTEYTVTLRDGAKFSDGKDVTADDVVKSYQRTTAEGSLYISMLDFIDSVTASGSNKVTFKLKKAFPMLKQRLALIQITPASATDEELKKQPVGSGPWKYTSITDQQIKFEKNDKYNGQFPAQTKNMVWNISVDDTARTTAMQGGKTDAMELVPPTAFKTLERSGSEMKTTQGFNQAFVMFNTRKKPFDDKRVRQAILNAIDVNKLISNQLQGQAEAATSYLPKSFPYYHKAKNVYTKNISKAKQLLSEAGVSGQTFTLYTTDHSWITSLAPQVKNDLEELGFKVDIQSMSSSALYPNIVDTGNFSMVLAPGDPSVFGNDPDLLLNWWYGDNAWMQKRAGWKGSEGYTKLHELMDQAIAAKDDASRQTYWNQCYDLVSEEVPIYPLLHRKTTTAVKKGVFSQFSPIGSTGLNFIHAKLSKQ